MKATPDCTLYIDETGDHTITKSEDVWKRYLGISGPVISTRRYESFCRAVDDLKIKHFQSAKLPVLHRKEIMQSRGVFSCLQDNAKRQAFDDDFIAILKEQPYMLLGVVIDKTQHGGKEYRTLRHPYHYCLHALLERYCCFLNRKALIGHVIAESRGRYEDFELQKEYRSIYQNGTT